MVQNIYMNQFFKSIGSDLNMLDKMTDTKCISKVLVETLDSSKCKWAVIQSLIKNKHEISEITFELLHLNDIVNVGIDAGYLLVTRDKNADMIEFYDNEIFLSYTFFIDALHSLGIYYGLSRNFPYHNLVRFMNIKQNLKLKA